MATGMACVRQVVTDQDGDQEDCGGLADGNGTSAQTDHPLRFMQDGTRPDSTLHPTRPVSGHADLGGTIDDRLDLRPTIVRRLFENWKTRMHVLHPVVDINSLEQFTERFLRHNRDSLPSPSYHALDSHILKPDKKRKRSEFDADNPSCPQFCNTRTVGRSLNQAIFYLILALGKVIETPYASPTPSTPAQPDTLHSNSQSRVSSKPPKVDKYADRARGSPTNVESVPGLAYYREACLILGLFADSNALGCAQARLLAGLYKGQLGRVRESWSWYHDASRICRYHIVKQKLDKGLAAMQPPDDALDGLARRENMLLVLCWSCLQLESDILAEFDYPNSGLSAHEADLPYPRLRFCVDGAPEAETEAETSRIEHHYLGILYLRKRLNELHVNLYGKSLAMQSKDRLVEVLEENEAAIQSWKDMSITTNVSIEQWDDDDAPSDNLLTARLRAKYYGARYIALRPFLDYSLHAMEQLKTGKTLEELAVDAHGISRPSELALFRAINTMQVATIQEKARTCVKSAMHSTVAFDKVPGRLTITNIVGTAHAQFGNMLVLSATYDSGADWLARLVPAAKLRELLDRTIAFLDTLSTWSPTAATDLDILRRIKMHLFSDGSRNGDAYGLGAEVGRLEGADRYGGHVRDWDTNGHVRGVDREEGQDGRHRAELEPPDDLGRDVVKRPGRGMDATMAD